MASPACLPSSRLWSLRLAALIHAHRWLPWGGRDLCSHQPSSFQIKHPNFHPFILVVGEDVRRLQNSQTFSQYSPKDSPLSKESPRSKLGSHQLGLLLWGKTPLCLAFSGAGDDRKGSTLEEHFCTVPFSARRLVLRAEQYRHAFEFL